MIKTGFLLIADISGYTAYLSKTELDHAEAILEALLNALLQQIHSPLVISKIEGDAVFSYADSQAVVRTETILESIEALYTAFMHTREREQINTACTCKACSMIGTLDLKAAVHYGEFAIQRIGDVRELVGTDVNLVHRLMKNHVVEETGITSYAFFTQAAMDALKLKEFVPLLKPHSEEYEFIGRVGGYVYDLFPVWKRDRERRRLFIRQEAADLSVEFDLPVAPPAAWQLLLDPEIKMKSFGLDQMTITGKQNDREGIGSTHHCLHGKNAVDELIIDWQPFDYVTFEASHHLPGGKPVVRTATFEFKKTETGTRVGIHSTRFSSTNRLLDLAAAWMWRSGKPEFEKLFSRVVPEVLLAEIEARPELRFPAVNIPVIQRMRPFEG